jgi:hypothetical protein
MLEGMRNLPVSTEEDSLGIGADPPRNTEPQSNGSSFSNLAGSNLNFEEVSAAMCARGSVQGSTANPSVTDIDDVSVRGRVQGSDEETICPPWVKEVFFQDDDTFDDDGVVMGHQPQHDISMPTVVSCADEFWQYLKTAARSSIPAFHPLSTLHRMEPYRLFDFDPESQSYVRWNFTYPAAEQFLKCYSVGVGKPGLHDVILHLLDTGSTAFLSNDKRHFFLRFMC